MKVDILMAVYNGEKYVGKQIESIIEQTYSDWTLHIRDDASTDGTRVIVRQYARKYPDKIKLFENSENSGSPKANFFALIKESKADIIFTCDQDDIWEKDKIESVIKEFTDMDKPTLVHTDLTVIDGNDNIISKSMMKSQHIDPSRTKLNNMLVQNVVTGCTMAFNKALGDILKEPELMPVHDWWIGTVASIYGEIKFVDKCSVKYRKHNSNACGPQNMDSPKYITGRFKDKGRAEKMLELGYIMALEILEKYNVPYEYKAMLKEYSLMKQKNKIQKLIMIVKYGIWKSGFIRKIGQLWFM